MKDRLEILWERILDILDARVSVTKLAKPEDLVISNASLQDIKDGIHKVYTQVYPAEKAD